MVNQVLKEGGVQNCGGLKLLSGDGGADDGKDARADDRADAERGEAQPTQGLF